MTEQLPKLFLISFFVYGFVLIILYSLFFEKRHLIKSSRFLKYIIFVTTGGALIKLFFFGGVYLLTNIQLNAQLALTSLLVSFFLTFLGVFLYNYWLSKRFYNLTKKQAIFAGLIIVIFANITFSLVIDNYYVALYYIIAFGLGGIPKEF